MIHKKAPYKKIMAGPFHILTLRLDPETYTEVMDYAKSRDLSRSEALRDLVDWGLETAREIKDARSGK